MRMASSGQRKIAAELAKSELSGVGKLPSRLEQGEIAIHYRRVVTDQEYWSLDPQWCAIEPIDEAGMGKLLEENT